MVGASFFRHPPDRDLVLRLGVALARDLSLTAYLIKIFLPSCPAPLDCAELTGSDWRPPATRHEHAGHQLRAHRRRSLCAFSKC
jgi:hypothetical protein